MRSLDGCVILPIPTLSSIPSIERHESTPPGQHPRTCPRPPEASEWPMPTPTDSLKGTRTWASTSAWHIPAVCSPRSCPVGSCLDTHRSMWTQVLVLIGGSGAERGGHWWRRCRQGLVYARSDRERCRRGSRKARDPILAGKETSRPTHQPCAKDYWYANKVLFWGLQTSIVTSNMSHLT